MKKVTNGRNGYKKTQIKWSRNLSSKVVLCQVSWHRTTLFYTILKQIN